MVCIISDERRQALLDELQKERVWGSLVRFLDTIDSIEELEALTPTFREHAEKRDLEFLSYYERNLGKWPHPQLDGNFTHQFPFVAARLNEPWKIRIFLRAVEAREVPLNVMALMFDELLHRHEVNGEKFIHYPRFRGDDFCTALRILYHTQIPYWTVCELILGKMPEWGVQVTYSNEPKNGLHIWWDKAAWEAKFNR